MKQHQGIWLPPHERHMVEWMTASGEIVDGRGTYQIKKLRAAVSYVKQFRVAVDVGAHVGFWSQHLAKRFAMVQAFEPVALHRQCFALNVVAPNVTMHAVALGAAAGRVAMWTEDGSSGNSQVRGAGDIELRTLDSYAFEAVDFLKIDCEGYELYVLQGAIETLRRCRPTICVEQKPRVLKNFGFDSPEAVRFLDDMGAVVRQHYSGDYMMSWDD